MSHSAAPSRKRRKEARPSELTAAALDLFVEKGFAGTRLDDVAKRAGVSKGTLYLYFDSKEALFKAVVQEGIVPALAYGESIFAQHEGSAFDLLRQLVEKWWELVGGTKLGGLLKLMVAEARNFPELARYYDEQVIRRGCALLGAALERGMASGEFRRMDIETCIDVVIAPVIMLSIWAQSMDHCLGKRTDPMAYLDLHLDLLRRGLQVTQV